MKNHILMKLILISIVISTMKPLEIITNESDQSNVLYLFAHGLGATGKGQGNIYAQEYCNHSYPQADTWILGTPLAVFDFPDAKNDNVEYHQNKVNLGQETDIQAFKQAYSKVCDALPDHGVVACGVSRGAVTILNCAAQLDNLRAIIVESPFDTLKSVVKNLLRNYKVHWVPFSTAIGMKIALNKFPLIDYKGAFPIDHVDKLPKDLPIMLVHSRRDWVVQVNCSRRLYIKLLESNHTNVYYLELASGNHARLLCGPEGQLYHNIVHAFYKKHGLPHDESSAKEGMPHLKHFQPTIDDIKQRLKRRSPEIPEEELEEALELIC